MFILIVLVVGILILSTVFCVMQSMHERNLKAWDVNNKSDEEIEVEAAKGIRKLKVLTYGFLTVVFILLTVLNSVFITDEQQVAFTMTLGKTAVVEDAGLHFKLPFITTVEKYDATTKGMAIGYNDANNEVVVEDSLMITSDFNFVNTDFYIEYRISDPVEYKFGSNDPEGILRNIVQASIRNTVGLYTVDEVITTGKAEIQAVVKEQIIEKLEAHNTGLSIVNVTIQDAEPPTAQVSAAFKAVETAKQDAETAINKAKEKEKEEIPNAEAEADKIIKAAEATKTERINQATQEVAEFNALYNEYKENPETVKERLYYSMIEELLPNMEIIIGNDSKVIYVNNGQVTTN